LLALSFFFSCSHVHTGHTYISIITRASSGFCRRDQKRSYTQLSLSLSAVVPCHSTVAFYHFSSPEASHHRTLQAKHSIESENESNKDDPVARAGMMQPIYEDAVARQDETDQPPHQMNGPARADPGYRVSFQSFLFFRR